MALDEIKLVSRLLRGMAADETEEAGDGEALLTIMREHAAQLLRTDKEPE